MAMHSSSSSLSTNSCVSAALRGAGAALRESDIRMPIASGPSRRMMASALRAVGVAGATIVSNALGAEGEGRRSEGGCGWDCPLPSAISPPTVRSLLRRSVRGLACRFVAARNDRHPFVEALAARDGRHVCVVAQREMDDAPLDRCHGRQSFFPPVTPHAIRDFFRLRPQILGAFALEPLAIELDVFLDASSGQRFVGQHLERIEQLAVTIDHAARVAAVQSNRDLLVVLFAARDEIEPRERDHVVAPFAHRARGVRLFALLRNFTHEALEVARLKIILVRSATSSAATSAAAAITTAVAAGIASSTATAAT